MDFVQLHLHTFFSILDGVASPEDYAKKAAAMGMKSLAITDHGNMCGILRFSNACKANGLKAIIGCEFYVNNLRKDTEIKSQNYHLILLAKNEIGYKNLLKLNYDAVTNGYYYKPRTTDEMVFKYHEGIICMTACMGSNFNRLILDKKVSDAKVKLLQYKKVFGEDFYGELQFNELKEQKEITTTLLKFCKNLGIKTVITGDCHYLNKGDDKIQDLQIMIERRKRVSDENVFRFSVRHLYFHAPEDYIKFNEKFKYGIDKKEIIQAINNTNEVANKCDFVLQPSEIQYPKFLDDRGHQIDSSKILTKKCWTKINWGHFGIEYNERLKKELSVIVSKNFSDYFLIVEDLVKFAEKNNIAVGAGRGSAAGCLVSYLLGITRVDPLKFGLYFERFLNKDRKDPPDIDLDFESDRKTEIEEYLKQKYGRDRVAHIITFSTFRLKGALRDTFRVYEKETDKDFLSIIKKVWDISPISCDEVPLSKQLSPILNAAENEYLDKNKELFDAAGFLTGRIKNIGQHAGGTAITKGPIYEYIPVFKVKGEVVTGFIEGKDYRELSEIGVLKIDILGLDHVDILKRAKELIRVHDGVEVELDEIDLNDKKLLDALNEHD
ncbi:MAG TPA: DNA polymerase III subunit alpha, partial [Candidatus Nanoarchaeia archaeon]|nr:DNA polymerase III subunit alpha [Candidatus Nanoarchaeia archaeon]